LNIDEDKVVLRNYQGKICSYPQILTAEDEYSLKVPPQILREKR